MQGDRTPEIVPTEGDLVDVELREQPVERTFEEFEVTAHVEGLVRLAEAETREGSSSAGRLPKVL
jgi:hypothetical protein